MSLELLAGTVLLLGGLAGCGQAEPFEYDEDPEVILTGVTAEKFEDRYEPMNLGKGTFLSTTVAGDVYPVSGTAEYRGWYQINDGGKASRWCPSQSKFGGPRPDGKKHGGADLFSYGQETIVAVTAGNVEFQKVEREGWGEHIYLYFKRDGKTYIAVYAHLDPSSEFEGVKAVKAGDIIGKAGCTGNAGDGGTCWTGFKCHGKVAREDHLHLELFPAPDPKVKMDPVAFFRFKVDYASDPTCARCASEDQLH